MKRSPMPPRKAPMRRAAPPRAPRPPLVLPATPPQPRAVLARIDRAAAPVLASKVGLRTSGPARYAMPVKADESRLYAAVASLPCTRPGCPGGCGPVQVAHSNQLRDGKARSLKAYPWRIAALGAACHVEIDSGARLSKVERREQWDEAHRTTIGLLFERGLLRPVAA